MALEELGLARQTVIAAFSIVFGASMLGLAIAFGLGGQGWRAKCLNGIWENPQKEKYKEPQPLVMEKFYGCAGFRYGHVL